MIIERLLALIAPHLCYSCSREGNLLCPKCASSLPPPAKLPPLAISGTIFAMTAYRGFAKRLVHAVKFDRAKAGAKDIGLGIAKILPLGYKTDVVTYVPTATARVRARGYDQAALIARVVAMEHKLPCYPLLGRTGQARQVGQDRNRRLRQMKRVFYPRGRRVPSSVLLVDDVLTTGATVTAAARALNEMGVKRIDVAVFAVAQSRRL